MQQQGSGDLNTNLVNIQRTLAELNLTLGSFVAGSNLPNYAFASLPATAGAGSLAFVTNARKPGEGAGLGTGMVCFFNPGTASWFTTAGLAVTI